MDIQLKKGLLDVCVLSVLRKEESYHPAFPAYTHIQFLWKIHPEKIPEALLRPCTSDFYLHRRPFSESPISPLLRTAEAAAFPPPFAAERPPSYFSLLCF